MQTSPIDVLDDDACARAHELLAASRAYERPWHVQSSLAEALVDWRHDDKAEPMEMWGAFERDAMLGVAFMWLPMEDNTSMTWADVHVDPARRGRGAGSALVQRVVARARSAARTQVIMEAQVPVDSSDEHPYRRFIGKHGFSLSNTEIVRHLDLPVADAVLDPLADAARPRYEGAYDLETHVDGVPQEHRESLCYVMNQLPLDAPTGEIDFEAESLTPARYAEYLDLERRQGRARLTTVAVARSTGDVVAYTDLVLPAGAPDRVWQWGTLVHRDHRGHRLGMAVKVENLRRLHADHPGRRLVGTSNDDTNRWMVDINAALGFRIVELQPCYRLELT